MPTGKNSNISRDLPNSLFAIDPITMFEAVPIRVSEPPIIDAYASGINIFEGFIFILRDRVSAIGSVIASAAISLMKPEIRPTNANNKINGIIGLFSNLSKYS
jgi:hypothetical protein